MKEGGQYSLWSINISISEGGAARYLVTQLRISSRLLQPHLDIRYVLLFQQLLWCHL